MTHPADPAPDFDQIHTDLAARIDALEEQVAALREDAAASATLPAADASAEGGPAVDGPATGVSAGGAVAGGDPAPATAASAPADPFWAVTALHELLDPPGGVVYAGSVDLGEGPLDYQWGRPTGHLLAADWAELAEPIAALGHPLRMAILRRLLDGEHTVAQIVDELDLGSTGVAYHHLSALQAGGWVTSPSRGSWSVPKLRIVPLLAIVLALEKG